MVCQLVFFAGFLEQAALHKTDISPSGFELKQRKISASYMNS